MTTTAFEALARFARYQNPEDAKFLNKFDIKDFLFSVQRQLEKAASNIATARLIRVTARRFDDSDNEFYVTARSTDTVGDLKLLLNEETGIQVNEMVLERPGHPPPTLKVGGLNNTSLYDFFGMSTVPIELDDLFDFGFNVMIFPTPSAKPGSGPGFWGDQFALNIILVIDSYTEMYTTNITRHSTAQEAIDGVLSQVENLPETCLKAGYVDMLIKGRGDKPSQLLQSDDVVWNVWVVRRSRIYIFISPKVHLTRSQVKVLRKKRPPVKYLPSGIPWINPIVQDSKMISFRMPPKVPHWSSEVRILDDSGVANLI